MRHPHITPCLARVCMPLARRHPVSLTRQSPADAYPAKPIRMINSLSAGSSADNLNRIFAEGLGSASISA